MKLVFALALLAVILPSALAQGCKLQQSDIASINLSSAAGVCKFQQPTPDQCVNCACELFKPFWGTDAASNILFRLNGWTCDNLPSESDLTNAITPCINTLLPKFTSSGISVQSLLGLRSCPRSNACITEAVKAQCPNVNFG